MKTWVVHSKTLRSCDAGCRIFASIAMVFGTRASRSDRELQPSRRYCLDFARDASNVGPHESDMCLRNYDWVDDAFLSAPDPCTAR